MSKEKYKGLSDLNRAASGEDESGLVLLVQKILPDGYEHIGLVGDGESFAKETIISLTFPDDMDIPNDAILEDRITVSRKKTGHKDWVYTDVVFARRYFIEYEHAVQFSVIDGETCYLRLYDRRAQFFSGLDMSYDAFVKRNPLPVNFLAHNSHVLDHLRKEVSRVIVSQFRAEMLSIKVQEKGLPLVLHSHDEESAYFSIKDTPLVVSVSLQPDKTEVFIMGVRLDIDDPRFARLIRALQGVW